MRPFRLRKDARDWFKILRDKKVFLIDFDIYYFCFIAGISTRTKMSVPNDETAEIVTYFPDKYSQRARVMIGLFLKSELELLGVSMDERQQVYSTISGLLDPESSNFLSDRGMREFNHYAHGGFETLIEWFDDRPRSVEAFVQVYKRGVDGVM